MTDEFLFASLVEDKDMLRELCSRAGISLAGVETPFTTSSGAVTINITSPQLGDGARNAITQYAETLEALADSEEREQPEPSEVTTATEAPGIEPEPSEATTHSDRGLFWFTDPPAHLKRSK